MSSPTPPGLWASVPFDTQQISNKHLVVISKVDSRHATLDRNVASMLQVCRPFRTIPEHVQEIVRLSPAAAGDAERIEQLLSSLVAQGLFTSADDLAGPLDAAADAETPQLPLRIVIGTSDRPEALERLLRSLADNQSRFGNAYPVDVVDDSRNAEAQARNAAIVHKYQERLDLTLVDRPAQQALVEALSEAHPEHRDSFEWLLGPRADQDPDGGTYGLPINHGILRGWGGKVLFFDDDAIVRGWRRSGFSDTPETSVGKEAENVFVFGSDDEASAEVVALDQDPIALHAAYLGDPSSRALGKTGNHSADALAGKTADALLGLDLSAGHIRTTSNGAFGDPGTLNDQWLLSAPFVTPPASQWPSSRYRRIAKAPRSVYRGRGSYNFAAQEMLQKTTCMGVSVFPYMAPMAPAGRGEDSLAAGVCRYLYPNDLALSLPFALEHRPLSSRTWLFDSTSLGKLPPIPDLLRRAIFEIHPHVTEQDPRARGLELARRLRRGCEGAAGLENVKRMARSERVVSLSMLHTNLYNALATADPNKASASWRQDAETQLQALLQRITGEPDPVTDEAAEAIQGSLLRYADALVAWDKAVTWIESK